MVLLLLLLLLLSAVVTVVVILLWSLVIPPHRAQWGSWGEKEKCIEIELVSSGCVKGEVVRSAADAWHSACWLISGTNHTQQEAGCSLQDYNTWIGWGGSRLCPVRQASCHQLSAAVTSLAVTSLLIIYTYCLVFFSYSGMHHIRYHCEFICFCFVSLTLLDPPLFPHLQSQVLCLYTG